MLKTLLVKLYLFFHGVRFYTTDRIPKTGEFKKAEFYTIDGCHIKFYFYKEIYEDLIFKRNKFYKEKFIGYLIQADLDPKIPEEFQVFNNLKIVFNSNLITAHNENEVDRELLAIYISFMKQEMQRLRKLEAEQAQA